jgi:hypothetical protein
MPKQTCVQRCAGGRARGGNSGYGQPKGGQKGGLIQSIRINRLIFNIYMINCGALHGKTNLVKAFIINYLK